MVKTKADLVLEALKKIKPVLNNKLNLRAVIEKLSPEEISALKNRYIPLVVGKPHWAEDQKIVSKISSLL